MSVSSGERRFPPRQKRSFTVLRFRDFRLFLIGDAISMLGSQVQLTALAWHVFQLTGDPFQLGLLGLARFLPILLFGFVGGLIADARDRRSTLLATQIALGCTSLLLASATLLGTISIGLIYALTIVSASIAAISGPTKQSLLPHLVPRGEMTSAMTMNVLSSQTANVGGPALGGFAIALFGLSTAYLLDACSFLAVVIALVLIKRQSPRPMPVARGWGAVFAGLRFVRTSRILLGVMAVDLVATFFGASTILMPIFAEDVFNAGPRGLGLLLSAPAVGAVVASALFSLLPPPRHPGAGVLLSVGVYGSCVAAFALTDVLPLALLLLALGGSADAISMALRHSLRNLLAPDEVRGRVAATHSIFAMGGPRLGEFESGVAASWIGVAPTVFIGGIATIVTALVAARFIPAIVTYDASLEEVA